MFPNDLNINTYSLLSLSFFSNKSSSSLLSSMLFSMQYILAFFQIFGFIFILVVTRSISGMLIYIVLVVYKSIFSVVSYKYLNNYISIMVLHNTNQENKAREIRGLSILAKGDEPSIIDKETFIIPSQSGNGSYKVIHKEEWVCECLDFKNRHLECKHIKAIMFFLKFRNKIEIDDLGIDKELKEEKCPCCDSANIVKNGIRKTKIQEKQRYRCEDCKKRFVLEPIKYVKGNSKLICLCMDLYFKGLSLRDISDTLYQFYGVKIHFDTIRRWIQKFTKIMNDYADKFRPKTSGKLQVDEQKVKSKGKWVWSWNALDEETRFLLANNITKGRSIKDAREIFRKVKENLNEKPTQIKTDGLWSYERAIKKEFVTHKGGRKTLEHIRNVGISEEKNNNRIERYHGQFREFDKVKRGFKSNLTTSEWNQGFRLYHNFIKPHMSLNSTTPSQVANIDLKLGRNRWLGLLEKALT